MRFLDLDPAFLRATDERSFRKVETLDEAHGVKFLCPKCYAANGGAVGTHMIICWSKERGAPDGLPPMPGRWRLDGTGLADLTLNAEPPSTARSVLLTGGGCGWHGYITNGAASDA